MRRIGAVVYCVFDVGCQLVTQFLRNGHWLQLSSLHGDQNVFSGRDHHVGVRFCPHLEVEVDGAATDLSKVCIDNQQFVEGHGMKEVALHMDAWQPDAEAVKERAIGKTAGTEELHFGQPEE